MQILRGLCSAAALAACFAAASSRFQNRSAWTIETAKLRVTILESGGHVGEIVLKGPGEVNPLWVQSRPTIDADQYDPARHEKLYGGGSGARLMSGLVGHNLCFPYWGDPSPAEARAGMTFHGETGIVRWKQISAADNALTVSADLPESRTRFTRTVRVDGQIAYFDETAENQSAWDRPIGWCEHVTLGPPFLERGVTVIDASLTRGRNYGAGSRGEFVWPHGFEQQAIDLRRIRNLARSAGFVNNFLVDPSREYGFFAAFNPKSNLLFGYLFRRAQFRWMNIWEANEPEMFTRGMEFSNTPVHGTLRALMKEQELFGTPTYEWLEARGKLRKRYCAFSVKVPASFAGTSDVRVSGNRLEIVEQATGKRFNLPFRADWL